MPTPHSHSAAFVHREIGRLADEAAAAERTIAELMPPAPATPSAPVLVPVTGREARNPLRPRLLDDVIGQDKLKPLLRRLIDNARSSHRPLDHLLFVGAAGTGKTTLATVIANEVGSRVFVLKPPVDTAMLGALRDVARDGDVVFIDEIHNQVSGDRRGLTQACDPESFYMLLEDGVLSTPSGPVSFPHVTWIGATTDVGLLPLPLSDRFTLQPRLDPYTLAEMATISQRNAQALDLSCSDAVNNLFAGASRSVPRQVNNYMRAARQLSPDGIVSGELAREVVEDLSSTTLDGLTQSMQTVLRFLYTHCRRESKLGVSYSASVNTLATACGHGRDTKAISLLVEPYLLQRGLLEVRPTGRTLTTAGVERARQLVQEVRETL